MKNVSQWISSFGILLLMLLGSRIGHATPSVDEGQPLPYSVLTQQVNTVLTIAFNPKLDKSNVLATGHSALVIQEDGPTQLGGIIYVWDTNTHKLLHTLDEHNGLPFSLAFSPDGKTFASGSTDTNVRLWNLDEDKFQGTLGTPTKKHIHYITTLAFNADGSILASGSADGTVRLWDPDNGVHLTALTGYNVPVVGLAFSSKGSLLAVGRADNVIRVWNLNTGKLQHQFSGHTAPILSLAFNVDNSVLASGSADATLKLWDTSTHASMISAPLKIFRHDDWVNSVAFNETYLASGSFDTKIRLWNMNTNALQYTLTAHRNSVENVAFSADGTTLASAGADGKVFLWQLPQPQKEDVNRDGTVNKLDLMIVDSLLGTEGTSRADVNNDKIVDVRDLIQVRNAMKTATVDIPAAVKQSSDIDGDGDIDMWDLLIEIDALIGTLGPSHTDINKDGVINIVDLVLVANAIGSSNANAPALYHSFTERITVDKVQRWLTEARLFTKTSPAFQNGVLMLEKLLETLTPKSTALLPNYPNPFNPETWIPYQLAEPADVTVTIYAANGTLVRTFKIGHQPAGTYQNRARAVRWDGKNEFGDTVASGLYFYTLQTRTVRNARKFTATRKMLIRK